MAGVMDRLIKEEVEDEEDMKFALQTKQEDSKNEEANDGPPVLKRMIPFENDSPSSSKFIRLSELIESSSPLPSTSYVASPRNVRPIRLKPATNYTLPVRYMRPRSTYSPSPPRTLPSSSAARKRSRPKSPEPSPKFVRPPPPPPVQDTQAIVDAVLEKIMAAAPAQIEEPPKPKRNPPPQIRTIKSPSVLNSEVLFQRRPAHVPISYPAAPAPPSRVKDFVELKDQCNQTPSYFSHSALLSQPDRKTLTSMQTIKQNIQEMKLRILDYGSHTGFFKIKTERLKNASEEHLQILSDSLPGRLEEERKISEEKLQAMAVDGGGYRARTEMKLEENRKIEEQIERAERTIAHLEKITEEDEKNRPEKSMAEMVAAGDEQGIENALQQIVKYMTKQFGHKPDTKEFAAFTRELIWYMAKQDGINFTTSLPGPWTFDFMGEHTVTFQGLRRIRADLVKKTGFAWFATERGATNESRRRKGLPPTQEKKRPQSTRKRRRTMKEFEEMLEGGEDVSQGDELPVRFQHLLPSTSSSK